MADEVKRRSSKRTKPSETASKPASARPKSIIQVPKNYKIHILGTELATDDKKPYTVYKIEVTRDVDAWLIYRRYSQFHALYTELKSSYGTEVKLCGDFPPKQILRNLSPHSVDRRHQRLQDWLKAVCINPRLESHPKVQLFIQQGKQDADFVPRQRSALIDSDIEVAGHLFLLKKGHWKHRWLVFRHGLLYKYMHPKEKHPYGFYDLRDAYASPLDLQRLGDSANTSKRATITDSRSTRESGTPTHSFCVEISEKGGKTKRTLIMAAQTEEILSKWIARINKDKNFQGEEAEFKKVFGVPLAQVEHRDSHGVPLFLSALLNYLQATALDDVELFTRPADEEIKRTIDRGGLGDLAQLARDIHKVAGLVLQYLQELPDSLIPADLQDCFYAMFKIDDPTKRHQLIMAISEVLPKTNRAILVKLFSFLHSAAFDAAETNDGLALPRLAKIFGRLIFRPRPEGPSLETILTITTEMITYPGLFVEMYDRATRMHNVDLTESESEESFARPLFQSKSFDGDSGRRKKQKKTKGEKKRSKRSGQKEKKRVKLSSSPTSHGGEPIVLGNSIVDVESTEPTEDSTRAPTGDTSATASEPSALVDAASTNEAPKDPTENDIEENDEEEYEEEPEDDEDEAAEASEQDSTPEPSPRGRPSRPVAPPSGALRFKIAGSTPQPEDAGAESSSSLDTASTDVPEPDSGKRSSRVVDLDQLPPEARKAVEQIIITSNSAALLGSATKNRPKPQRNNRVTSSAVKVPLSSVVDPLSEPAPAPLSPKQQLLLDLNRALRSNSAPVRKNP